MRKINGQDSVFDKLVQGNDEITFNLFYLVRGCEDARIYTDDKSYIVAQSNQYTPIWIFANEQFDTEAENEVYQILADCVKENPKVHINAKPEFMSGIFARLEAELNVKYEKYKGLIAYKCPQVKLVEEKGQLTSPRAEHKERMIDLVKQITEDISHQELPHEEAVAFADKHTDSENLFLWQDGDIVSMARIAEKNEKYARINYVVTDRAKRNRGYVKMLVGNVSKILLEQGVLPMLYADDNNPYSNAAYQRIGYLKVGEITEFYNKNAE